jgi:hypothetical protein
LGYKNVCVWWVPQRQQDWEHVNDYSHTTELWVLTFRTALSQVMRAESSNTTEK